MFKNEELFDHYIQENNVKYRCKYCSLAFPCYPSLLEKHITKCKMCSAALRERFLKIHKHRKSLYRRRRKEKGN